MARAPLPVGRLVICPTPIGNLQDVTLRVLGALRDADVVACEDTRRTGVLLKRHGLTPTLVSVHEHNERARADALVERMRAGEVVALVSDAGTPLVCDPGFALVRACLAADIAVEVLPGPSAVLTALLASGLPAERWCFVGFLPRKRGELAQLLQGAAETLVAFESPRRLASTLDALAALDPGRPLAVCRELTKLHEEVRRGSARELADHYAGERAGGRGRAATSAVRGEVSLVIGGGRNSDAAEGHARSAQAVQALRELVAAGARARPAASAIAKLTGVGANELYRRLTSAEQ